MECKFLVNHTRSIGEIHSCSKCQQYTHDCPHDITQVVVCPTLSRHDIVLGEERQVRDRQSMRASNPDCAGWSKLCWMHDPSIRPKRHRRAWTTNTLTPPRKCQQLKTRAAKEVLEEDDSTAEPKSATPLIGLRLNDDPPKFWLTRNFATLANI